MSDSRAFNEFEPPSQILQPGSQEAGQAPRAGESTAEGLHAVIRRYEGLDPRSIDEVARRVNEGLVPIISQIPGFVAYCALDAGSGVVASITVFEDRAGADESTRKAAGWVKQHLAALVPNPPQFTAGRVIAYTGK
jgi:hypothetical protein